ncbi:MAG: SsrA-binding protein SmpB [Planctomycetes bacterium]|nr:SsrA-binding protein SmpB [Planctomycetota bacterium]
MAKKNTNPAQPGKARRGVCITNRKARHKFHLIEKVECGMELTGTEVKSLRAGAAKIDEAYARIRGGEVFLVGMNIPQYPNAAGALQHEPLRDRKLLLHRRQIARLETHVRQKGKTLVPTAVYFNNRGLAKCELAVAVGKRAYDKRDAIRRRDQQREMDRALRRGGRRPRRS